MGIINWQYLQNLLLAAIASVLAIVIHELAHGFSAYLMGDATAKNDGRLSLNPLKHIDPIGALCLVLFHFGWAKPVPVNPYLFKNRKWGMVFVSASGPVSNLLLAFIALITFTLLNDVFLIGGTIQTTSVLSIVDQFLILFAQINLGLFVFNLIPVPPLDGSKILAQFLPPKPRYTYLSFEKYGGLVLFVAVYILHIGDALGSAINFLFYQLFNLITRIFV